MSDEGLHEIQLNGKQLVFLFMTATVVAVVIFLCGVMVGRGVPVQRGTPVIAADGVDPTAPEESRSTAAPSDLAATPSIAGGSGASPSSREKVTYPGRLEEPEPVSENIQDTGARPDPFKASNAVAKPPAPSAPPSVSNAVATVPKAPSKLEPRGKNAPKAEAGKPGISKQEAPRVAEPTGTGFVVQVTAVKVRSDADAIRQRLAKKGYPAFITTSGSGNATVYRVRVGKYDSRREADAAAGKLERDEQFKPWVTR